MNNFVSTPGGRESRQFNVETEVRVALQQWKYGTLAALVLAFLLQRFVVNAGGRLARTVMQGAFVTSAEKTAASVLLFLALFLPALAAFTNFILNLYDSNMPAPRQAQPAADGPNAPGWVRWLSGWRDRNPPAQEEIYTGRAAPVDAPQEVVVTADLLLGTKGHAQKVQIALPLDEWRKLQRYVAKGGRSVSESDLVNAGFSSGPNGRARAIGKAFTAYEGATEKGDKGKPLLVDKLAEWIMDRGYARGLDLPL